MILKHALRSIASSRFSSEMSVFSLIISFLGIIILVFFISFEYSFDKFHKDADHIFSVENGVYGEDSPAGFVQMFKDYSTEVEKITLYTSDMFTISTPEKEVQGQSFRANVGMCQEDFFDIFTIKTFLGNPDEFISVPSNIVLTTELSEKLFGNINSINETVTIDNKEYTVSGIVEKFPYNSTIQADCFVNIHDFKAENLEEYAWKNWSSFIFIKAKDQDALRASLKEVSSRKDFVEKLPTLSKEVDLEPRKMTDRYFEYVNPSAKVIIRILIILAIVLVIMGMTNYVNFTMAQVPIKLKKSAIMRMMGCDKILIKKQLLSESIILSIWAFVIALILYFAVAGIFENIFDVHGISINGRYGILIMLFAGTLLFGYVASLLPSLYISDTPLECAMKGSSKKMTGHSTLRDILLTIQFLFSIILICTTLILNRQMHYLKNADMGFNKKDVVFIQLTPDMRNRQAALAEELIKNIYITDYSYSSYIPGQINMRWGRDVEGKHIELWAWPVDYRFINFMGIELIEGDGFSKNMNADCSNAIFNEKAISKFNWDKPFDIKIDTWGVTATTVGVVKDFNFESLKSSIEPLILTVAPPEWFNYLLLKVKPENREQVIPFINEITHKFDPKMKVDVQFLEDSIDELYAQESRVISFIEMITIWCMLISIIGLFGMVVFTCHKRIKELGIRKVNGATTTELILNVNKSFLISILIAYVIALPIIIICMKKLLAEYAFRIDLSWMFFAATGIIVLIIAIATVSYQSYKAATRNPIKALKYE